MGWNLYLFSDLHLEVNGNDYVMQWIDKLSLFNIDKDDVLVLAGDIFHPDVKTYDYFFKFISNKFQTIIYVFGNHEYYSEKSFYIMSKYRIRQILNPYSNIHILDNDVYFHKGIKFVGTTLWTKITKNSLEIERRGNDYKKIYTNNRRIKVTDVNKWNYENINWLLGEISGQTNCIIVSHHAPLFNMPGIKISDPSHISNGLEEIYHNDLRYLLRDSQSILAWCYGHTHYATEFEYEGVVFFSNPLGYFREQPNFKPEKHLTFSTNN